MQPLWSLGSIKLWPAVAFSWHFVDRVKGTVSRDGDIFQLLTFLSVLSLYALVVFKVFQKLLTTIFNYLHLFASLKLLTSFENAHRNPPQNFLLCGWPMFSSADLSLVIVCKENEQELTSYRRHPVILYRITDGFLNAFPVSISPRYGLWSGVLEGFSKLVIQISKLKLSLICWSTKKQNVKTSSASTET